MSTRFFSTCAILFCAFAMVGEAKEELNIAKPSAHPYVMPKEGREGHRRSDHSVNEARVYDFYARQADYYMKAESMPAVLPAYPGLDAGRHGHWGKHNQNGHKDGRWNDMQHDGVVGELVQFPKGSGLGPQEDAVIHALDEAHSIYAVFSPRTLNYLFVAKGANLFYDPFRWGTSRGAQIRGTSLWHGAPNAVDAKTSAYYGSYRQGKQLVFHYRLNGVEVLDTMRLVDGTPVRTLEFPKGAESFKTTLLRPKADTKFKSQDEGTLQATYAGKTLTLCVYGNNSATIRKDKSGVFATGHALAPGAKLHLAVDRMVGDVPMTSLQTLKTGSPSIFASHRYKTTGTLAKNSDAYVVDDVDLPFSNKQKSLMFLTGIDFTKDGTAYVSTLQGEIWRLTGLTGDLAAVTWQKVASGLNQPFGLRIWDGRIHVLQRTRLTVLHDLNNDGEFEYFQCLNNEIMHRPQSHSHKFGLERDANGDFYFVVDTTVVKVDAKTGKLSKVASGVRNCMGVGALRDGTILVGPQEGTNTPASAVLEVRQGDFYGHKGKGPLAAPMCYIPRGVDNSTGGFYHADDSRWGPLGKSIIGLSYGYGQWYQILRDQLEGRDQGATVPMDGSFFAGVVRAATNPVDGQLYVVGLDGWGDYSTQDGCLHRIRYTGKPLYKPTGFHLHTNGIRVDFPVALDPASATVDSFFYQMWEYVNSRQYGSPEYAANHSEKLGHDPLPVTNVVVLPGGKSLFVEIPDLKPVMQSHLRMHLTAADGTAFKADLFPTVRQLDKAYEFPEAKPLVPTVKPKFVVRTKKEKKNALHTFSGKRDDHARKVIVKAIGGMKYDVAELRLKAGESVALVLQNTDGMPHNFVIVKPGAYQSVGMAAFNMLNDPKAADKHYVPDSPDVIAHTFIVQPKGSHTTWFMAPKKPGKYPFLCTFPGHWQLMKGTIIVE